MNETLTCGVEEQCCSAKETEQELTPKEKLILSQEVLEVLKDFNVTWFNVSNWDNYITVFVWKKK